MDCVGRRHARANQGLFSRHIYKREADAEPILRNVRSRVTDDQNTELLHRFEESEIKDANFSMYPDKSPGPDEMNAGFFLMHIETWWETRLRDHA